MISSINILHEVYSEKDTRWAYMLICLYAYMLICLYAYMLICLRRDESDEFYCIKIPKKYEQKSDCNYRKNNNCQSNFNFKIIRDLFKMNCEFAFDIRRGAN